MSTIEPTEEQKQAAKAFFALHEEPHEVTDSGAVVGLEWSPTHTADDVARLLAEREAKLREDLTKQCNPTVDMCGGCSACVHWLRERNLKLDTENDTLRARVAELEALFAAATNARVADTMANLEREAQHLADIKALMAKRLVDMREAARWGAEISANVDDATDHQIAADIMEEFATFDAEDALLQRLAHYDDAKADAPAVSPEMDTLLTKALEAVDARAGQSDEEWAKGVAPFIVADLDDGRHPDWPEVPGVLDARECEHPRCGQTCEHGRW